MPEAGLIYKCEESRYKMEIKLKEQHLPNDGTRHLLKLSQIAGSDRPSGQLVRVCQFLLHPYVSREPLINHSDILCDEDLELLESVIDHFVVQ